MAASPETTSNDSACHFPTQTQRVSWGSHIAILEHLLGSGSTEMHAWSKLNQEQALTQMEEIMSYNTVVHHKK